MSTNARVPIIYLDDLGHLRDFQSTVIVCINFITHTGSVQPTRYTAFILFLWPMVWVALQISPHSVGTIF